MAAGVAAQAVIPIEAMLLSLAILIASGRLVPRALMRQRLTASDGFLLASIVNAIGLFATDALTYKWGGMSDESADAPAPPEGQVIALKKVQFAGNAFYDTGIYLPKLAILALYFRLIPPTMPWLRKVLYVVTSYTVCAMCTTFFLDTFWCGRQVSLNWSTEEGACNTFDSKEVFQIDWATNISSDVFIFMLPFPLLKNLKLNRRQIWGLVATFSLGAITVAMSVVRFVTIQVIQAWTNVFVLSMAEMAIAIMVVSLPAMRSFLRRGSFFSLSKKSTSYPSRPGYAQRTPVAGSKGFGSVRSKNRPRVLHDEESGSEVELNNVARTDVIYATRRVSVQYSDRSLDISKDEDETHKQHFEAK